MNTKKIFNSLKKGKSVLLLIAILVLALFLRTYELGFEELTYSEFVTLQIVAQHSIKDALHSIQEELHPPIYYLLVYFQSHFFGLSGLDLRIFSVISGLLSLILIYIFVNSLFNERIALLVTFIMAVLPFHIFSSMVADSYMFFFFTIMLHLIFFIKFIKEPDWKKGFFYAFFSLLMIYTHYFGIMLIVMENLYFFIYLKNYKKCLKEWLVSNLAICLFIIFHLKKLFYDVTQYIIYSHNPLKIAGIYFNLIQILDRVKLTFLYVLKSFSGRHSFMLESPKVGVFNIFVFYENWWWHILELILILFSLCVLIIFLITLFHKKTLFRRFKKDLPIFVLFIILSIPPLIFCAVFPPFFRIASFIYLMLFFFIILICCLVGLKNKLIIVLFILFIALFGFVFGFNFSPKEYTVPFRDAVGFIKSNMEKNDLIVIPNYYDFFQFLLYYDNSINPAIFHYNLFNYSYSNVIGPPHPLFGMQGYIYNINFDSLNNMTQNRTVWVVWNNYPKDDPWKISSFFYSKNYTYTKTIPINGFVPLKILFFSNERLLS